MIVYYKVKGKNNPKMQVLETLLDELNKWIVNEKLKSVSLEFAHILSGG